MLLLAYLSVAAIAPTWHGSDSFSGHFSDFVSLIYVLFQY